MNALDIIEQLESLSPAELQHEISEQRDRLALMERLYALLTGDSIKPGKRTYRKDKPPTATTPTVEDDTPPADTTDLRRRLVDLLKTLGPLSWTQLISNAKASPTVLGPAMKAAQANGQIEKRSDGLYHAVGK
jgi:hypothetical protein